jgi:hypothetical protein
MASRGPGGGAFKFWRRLKVYLDGAAILLDSRGGDDDDGVDYLEFSPFPRNFQVGEHFLLSLLHMFKRDILFKPSQP